jgi:hypothetical protein
MRDDVWHYECNERACGPVSSELLRQLVSEGQVHPDTRVWREGMADWAPLGDAWPSIVAPALSEDSSTVPQDSPPEDGLPWEVERSVRTAFRTAWLLLASPSKGFSRISASRGMGPALLFNVILSTLGCAVGMAFELWWKSGGHTASMPAAADSTPQGPLDILGMLAVFPVIIALGAFLQSGFIHLCLTLFGAARESIETTFRACNYASGSAAMLLAVPFIGPLLSVSYNMVMLAVGLAQCHQVSWQRSTAALFVPLAVIAIVRLLALRQ